MTRFFRPVAFTAARLPTRLLPQRRSSPVRHRSAKGCLTYLIRLALSDQHPAPPHPDAHARAASSARPSPVSA
jgi:hypothetical protein